MKVWKAFVNNPSIAWKRALGVKVVRSGQIWGIP